MHVIIMIIQWTLGYSLMLSLVASFVVACLSRLPFSTITPGEFGVLDEAYSCNSTAASGDELQRQKGSIHNEFPFMIITVLICLFGNLVSHYHAIGNWSYVALQDRKGERSSGLGEVRLISYPEVFLLMAHMPKIILKASVVYACLILVTSITDFKFTWFWGEYIFIFFEIALFGVGEILNIGGSLSCCNSPHPTPREQPTSRTKCITSRN